MGFAAAPADCVWDSAYDQWRTASLAGAPASAYKTAAMKNHLLLFAGALMLVLTSGCSSMKEPLRPVAHVDLPRYMGDWYVIANIPYFAEKGCVDSIESYALRPDGDIDNWFTCRKKSFDAPMKRKATARAVVDDKVSNAQWRVKFFKVVSVKYLVLDLDPKYQWAVVGHPSRDYGWILSRSKTLDEGTYQKIMSRLSAQSYDTSRFQKVPQQADGATASPH
jgi:apolipoprotein D and lipocalin family protein